MRTARRHDPHMTMRKPLVARTVGLAPMLTLAGSPVAAAAPATNAGLPTGCPWMDTRKSPEQPARRPLAATPLDPKLRWLDERAAISPNQAPFHGVTYPVQVPCTPAVVYSAGPDYVRGASGPTIFPAQIGLAASWSASLAYEKGKAQGDEAFRAG